MAQVATEGSAGGSSSDALQSEANRQVARPQGLPEVAEEEEEATAEEFGGDDAEERGGDADAAPVEDGPPPPPASVCLAAVIGALKPWHDQAVQHGIFSSAATAARREVDMTHGPHNLKMLLGMWLASFIAGLSGLLSWFGFIVLALLYTYGQLVNRGALRAGLALHLLGAAEVLTLSEEPDNEIRDYDGEWLNKVMHEFWPHSLGPWLTQKLRVVLRDLINDSLSGDCSKGSSGRGFSAAFDSFSLGERAPEILRVKEHLDRKRLFLDLDFFAECTGQIKLSLQKGRERMTMHLNDVRMRGALRLMFSSFLPSPPYFAQLSVSFVERPDLDFHFTIAGVGRGIGTWVKHLISRKLLDMMVYPYAIPVQLFEASDLDAAEADLSERLLVNSAPTGLLVVRLIQAHHLHSTDINGKSDPYVTFQIGSQVDKRSKVIRRTCNPQWNEEFRFKVWQRALEHLRVEVWDEDWASCDDFMGYCDVELSTVLPGDGTGAPPRVVRLYHPSDPMKEAGTLELELEYLPLESDIRRSNKEASTPRLTRQGCRSKMDGAVPGLLQVTLDRATNLEESAEKPYVVIRLVEVPAEKPEHVTEPLLKAQLLECKDKQESHVRPRTASWQQDFFFEVADAINTVAHVELLDKSRIHSDGSLGEFQVPLRAFMDLAQESSSFEAQLHRFLPQCVAHRWHGSTIVPTRWRLANRDRTTSHASAATIYATVHFMRVAPTRRPSCGLLQMGEGAAAQPEDHEPQATSA